MKIQFPFYANVDMLSCWCEGNLHTAEGTKAPVLGFCTDSSEGEEGYCFIAIRGEHVDGFEYIEDALNRGCSCVLADHSSEELKNRNIPVIVVSDPVMALSRIANHYRHTMPRLKVVGITGSVGKTTTKELIHSVLSTTWKTYATPANRNSTIGMPLSFLSMPASTNWGVMEMGMSGVGEIERMSLATEPNVAVITNIGTAHIEKLGSKKRIARAKLEILTGLHDGGTLVLNGDDPMLKCIGGTHYRTVYVSAMDPTADLYAENVHLTPYGTAFDLHWKGKIYSNISIRVLGRHNVYNAMYAIAAGLLSNIPMEDIRAGLWRYRPSGLAQNTFRLGDITIIQDCYNASPESMTAAVNVLNEYAQSTGGRSIAVLGPMLELGDQSSQLHREVGEHLAEQQIQQLITLGSQCQQIAVGAIQKGMSLCDVRQVGDDWDTQGQEMMKSFRPGDVILVKASRSVRAERLVEYWKENYRPESMVL